METNNIYQVYTNETINKKSCIEIQLGKQRKKRFKDSSLFFSTESFVPFEQTIWDNFREYSSNSTVKISSKEWKKILDGLLELSGQLKDENYNSELSNILGFKTMDKKQMYEANYNNLNLNINNMLEIFIKWLESNIKNNDFITING